jgi:hypothetical protein
MSLPFFYTDGAENVQKQRSFFCKTFISGAVVPPFTTPRGDIVSGSHVKAFALALGNNSSQYGAFQLSPGQYAICFGVPLSTDNLVLSDHKMLVNSGSTPAPNGYAQVSFNTPVTDPTAEQNWKVKMVTCANTGSSPFFTTGSVAGGTFTVILQIYSGSNTTPVDPTFDFEIDSAMVFTLNSIWQNQG